MLVVHHPEGALGEVVEHHAADQLVRFQHRNAEETLLEERDQFRVVVKLVQAVANRLILRLDQRLQSIDVVQFSLSENSTLRTIKSSSNSVKSYV